EQQRNKPEYYRQKIKIADAITHDQMLREYSAQAYFLNLGLDLGLKNFKFEDIYNTETYKNKKNELLILLEKNDELLKPIKHFIAIRYYLTAFKDYPEISTLNIYLDHKIPGSDPIFYELIWNYCLERIELDKN